MGPSGGIASYQRLLLPWSSRSLQRLQPNFRGSESILPCEPRKVLAARTREIDKNDAHDERSFDAFTECDKESRKHENSSCK